MPSSQGRRDVNWHLEIKHDKDMQEASTKQITVLLERVRVFVNIISSSGGMLPRVCVFKLQEMQVRGQKLQEEVRDIYHVLCNLDGYCFEHLRQRFENQFGHSFFLCLF